MGTFLSKKQKEVVTQGNDKGKNTETQIDSIMVSAVSLPVLGVRHNINFGLVNTTFDEIEKLIRDFQLNIPAAECSLVLKPISSDPVIMIRTFHIEHYRDLLSLESTNVQLIHNVPAPNSAGEPSVTDLNVKMK